MKLLVTPPPSDDGKTPSAYYDGEVYVSLKDATMQPSNPLRHAAETLAAIKLAGRQNIKVLVIKTDGGSDRNTTRVAVQLAFLALALELQLHCIVLMRTTPGQSYVNPVERVMSLLSLALNGVALARSCCATLTEALLKKHGSMSARREAMPADSDHAKEFCESMKACCHILHVLQT